MVFFFCYISFVMQFLLTIQYEELEISIYYRAKSVEQFDLVIYQLGFSKEGIATLLYPL